MPRYHGVVWCDSEGRGGALAERVDRTEVGHSTVHCTGQYSTVQCSTDVQGRREGAVLNTATGRK